LRIGEHFLAYKWNDATALSGIGPVQCTIQRRQLSLQFDIHSINTTHTWNIDTTRDCWGKGGSISRDLLVAKRKNTSSSKYIAIRVSYREPIIFCPSAPPRACSSICLPFHNFCLYAFPYVKRPYRASKLKPVGKGFWLFKALGIEEPARTSDARSASSTPYGCLVWMR